MTGRFVALLVPPDHDGPNADDTGLNGMTTVPPDWELVRSRVTQDGDLVAVYRAPGRDESIAGTGAGTTKTPLA